MIKYLKSFPRLKHAGTSLIFLSIPIITSAVYVWPWNTDMYFQPYIKSWERTLHPPENSIPMTGKEVTMAGQRLVNPIPVTEEAIKEGKEFFNIFCVLCHGESAKGDGPIAQKFTPPPDLTDKNYIETKDGYLYSIIKEGGAIMPAYGDRLSSGEIWKVVIYIRELQKNEGGEK